MASLSYSQEYSFECSVCGAPVTSQAWIVIDFEHSPEIWSQFRSGTLNLVTCPNQHISELKVPVLLHDGVLKRLFFFAEDSISDTENERIRKHLLTHHEAALYAHARGEEYQVGQHVSVPVTASPITGDLSSSDAASRGEALRHQDFIHTINEIYRRSGSDISLRAEFSIQALSSLDRHEEPLQWAVLEALLGNSLFHREFGEKSENVELAIQAYEEALTVLTPDNSPDHWGMVNFDLGVAYSHRTLGDTAVVAEKAINAFSAALAIYTRENHPNKWADTSVRLGDQYRRLTQGETAGNIREAIRHFAAALSIYSLESSPENWAAVQTRIGEAYARLMDEEGPASVDRAIEAFEAALRFYSPQEFPEEWASAQNYLANLYSRRSNGDFVANLNRAVKACEDAFTIYGRDSFPFEWADTQAILGICLLKRATDKPTREATPPEQVEDAIKAFEAALTVFRPENKPGQWASALSNLGGAYQERETGDVADNKERAIQLYEEVLAGIDKQQLPTQWAGVQVNLGDAYTSRIKGNNAENLRKALAAYEAAATIKTPYQDEKLLAKAQGGVLTAFSSQEEQRAGVTDRVIRVCEAILKTDAYKESPEKWATTQFSLGAAYQRRLRGNRVDNIERAMEAFREALAVFTPKSYSRSWRNIKIALADLYRERPSGSRAENIEEAIRIYQELLNFHGRSPSRARARMLLHLGSVYLERVYESRANNIELSIEACEEAVDVLSYDRDPEEWARGQLHLGLAYYKRVKGSREENIEAAIKAFESALGIYTREEYLSAWSVLHNNLGSAYSDRVRGSKADNLEKAIAAFERALEGYSSTADHERWAGTQVNLGSAYGRRIRGERADNIERAIRAFKAALSVITASSYPLQWVRVQISLGGAYLKRLVGDKDENVERAIQVLEAALTLNVDLIEPADWAGIQLNLASAYFSRSKRDEKNVEDQERALKASEAALKFFKREDFPEEWLVLQNLLSNIYSARLEGVRAENLECSIRALENALTAYNREAFPESWGITQYQLGNAYSERVLGDRSENLERAIEAYRAALEIHRPADSPDIARNAALHLGVVLSRQNSWEEAYAAYLLALEAAEHLYSTAFSYEGKTSEIATNVHVYKSLVKACLQLNPARPGEAFQHSEEGRARILRDQLGGLGFPPPPGIPPPLLEREQSLLHTIRGLNRAAQVSSDETMRQIWVSEVETALTELNSLWGLMAQDDQAANYVALRRGQALNWDEVQVWLLGHDCQAAVLEFVILQDQIIAFIVRRGEAVPRVVEIDLTSSRLLDFARRLRSEISHFDAEEPCEETWRGLAPILLPRIMPNLDGAELVYIVADDVLHYIPLHALEYGGNPLISYFPIVCIPSIATALRIRHHDLTAVRPQTTDLSGRFLVVGNPTEDLPFAEDEANEVAQQLKVRPLLRREATRRRVQSRMAGKDLAHFATHAFFHPHEPFVSGIILANRRVLTARDVLNESLGVRLLVLSGCETGSQSIGPGNELTGLANAFLYAGVSSLILSQWPVSDAVTARLMKKLYRRLFDSTGERQTSTAEALRDAMLETREENPHTYHWAPFFLFGQ